jgi:hypothetical protein
VDQSAYIWTGVLLERCACCRLMQLKQGMGMHGTGHCMNCKACNRVIELASCIHTRQPAGTPKHLNKLAQACQCSLAGEPGPICNTQGHPHALSSWFRLTAQHCPYAAQALRVASDHASQDPYTSTHCVACSPFDRRVVPQATQHSTRIQPKTESAVCSCDSYSCVTF